MEDPVKKDFDQVYKPNITAGQVIELVTVAAQCKTIELEQAIAKAITWLMFPPVYVESDEMLKGLSQLQPGSIIRRPR